MLPEWVTAVVLAVLVVGGLALHEYVIERLATLSELDPPGADELN